MYVVLSQLLHFFYLEFYPRVRLYEEGKERTANISFITIFVIIIAQ